jgi:hypothetical protein
MFNLRRHLHNEQEAQMARASSERSPDRRDVLPAKGLSSNENVARSRPRVTPGTARNETA